MKKDRLMTIIILAILIFIAIFNFANKDENIDRIENDYLDLVFFDVGQGDSSLIKLPNGETALIDGGSRRYSQEILDKLDDHKVSKIDYLIVTHLHEDHIGSLPEVIRNKEIGKIYMPRVSTNTKIFEDLLMSIKEKDLKISQGKSGLVINDYMEILGPTREHKSMNNNSLIVRLKYNDLTALYTGDAELAAEKDILDFKNRLKSDILKVGHHGSDTSSSKDFIDLVDPDIAVISVAEKNKYKHPSKSVIDRFNSRGARILRTDELGDIHISTDGKNIKINK